MDVVSQRLWIALVVMRAWVVTSIWRLARRSYWALFWRHQGIGRHHLLDVCDVGRCKLEAPTPLCFFALRFFYGYILDIPPLL